MSKPMKIKTLAALLALSLGLGACGGLQTKLPAGIPAADVTARLGKPTATYPDPDGGQWLEYRGQPMGQFQHMARIGADGRLQVNRWNREDILRHFGRPAETGRVRLDDREVWSYRYKQDGLWNSMMNVYFNARGVVVRLQNTPDPVLDERFKGM